MPLQVVVEQVFDRRRLATVLFIGERIFARAKSATQLNSLLASSRGAELGMSADL
jgi:hypothetical protein